MKARAYFYLLLMLLVVGAGVFTIGIGWGLPSRNMDAVLFGRLAPWDGERILRLAGGGADDPHRGADVDDNPLQHRDGPLCVNQTDEQRAEIIRRFRLYSYQPDEMITLMALGSMRPAEGRLDPKLYQYGGFWIYGVGALLKLAALSGNITLLGDLTYYLDFSEEFGKFYIVARLYSAAWALVGLPAVLWLVRRLCGTSAVALLVPLAAGLCYLFMPIVVDMAHEAKPHMPGAVLMLWAVVAAVRYVDTGRMAWWLATAVLCGLALGMVLSALPIFVILPVMVWLRRQPFTAAAGRVIVGGLIGGLVYLLTNPYVAINFFTNREVLRSNLSNSLAMYEIGRWPEGLLNALSLIATGMSVPLALAGLVAVIGMAVVRVVGRGRADSGPAVGWLLAVPAVIILAQFIGLAAGKPGEYGRFAVFIDLSLMLAAMAGVSMLPRSGLRGLVVCLLVGLTAWPGLQSLKAFARDCGDAPTRIQTAHKLAKARERGARTIGIFAEPAPYNFPPVDLFDWQIMLLPAKPTPAMLERIDVLLRVEDGPGTIEPDSDLEGSTLEDGWRWWRRSISWADRRFELRISKQPRSATQPASLPSWIDSPDAAMQDERTGNSGVWGVPVEPVPRE